MTTEDLSLCWQYYEKCSFRVHNRRCDSLAAGQEEQLGVILELIATGCDITPEHVACLERLPWNRAKKHVRLARTLREREYARVRLCRRPVARRPEFPPLDPAHWRVEVSLAAGVNYGAIASGLGTTVGGLKMRVSRWRRKVRAALAQ